MKIRFFISSIISILGLFSVIAPVVSNAAVVQSNDSNATIKFTEPDDAPPVIDPTDPTDPYEPGPGDPEDPPTGNTGPLTLDYVSSLDFGEHAISSSEEIYQSTILRPFIQVTDRRGTGDGWRVVAKMSEFNDGATLPGAVVTLNNGTAISPTIAEESERPIPASSVVLNAGGDAAPVVTAQEDAGFGSWITRWFPSEESELNDHVTLQIPAGAATIGTHSATITWTLHDAPGQ